MTATKSRAGRRPPSRPSSRRNARKPFPVVPVVVGVLVLLAAVAFVATAVGGDDEETVAPGVEQVRPVRVDGDALPPFPGAADPAAGAVAPALEGASFDGTPVTIGPDGRAKVLVFLAHWCPHCQAEVPRLSAWMAENDLPGGVDVYAISTSTDPRRPNHPPSAWLEREGFAVPTLADDAASTASTAYGLTSFPFFVVLDGENRVVGRTAGELTTGQWEQLLDLAAGVSR